MRIEDIIYFSPNLRLEELAIDNKGMLLQAFKERIESYYFEPIDILVDNKQAFASGALQCILIDAFARYRQAKNGVKIRFVEWCEHYLELDNEIATEFYEFFRCGLLHETHIKKFGQFSFDDPFRRPVQKISQFIIVNPIHLSLRLKSYFQQFIQDLETDDALYGLFISRINVDFKDEVEKARQ